MFVTNGQLDGERVSLRHEDLKHQKLVHYVQTLHHAGSFRRRARTRVMKICLQLGWVWRQLNALVLKTENVAFDLRIEVFCDLRRTLIDGERFLGLRAYSKLIDESTRS